MAIWKNLSEEEQAAWGSKDAFKAAKEDGTVDDGPPSSSSSSDKEHNTVTGMSVSEQRAAAEEADMTVKEYKQEYSDAKERSQARIENATDTQGDITTYDSSSVGTDKYSHNDVKALKDQGYSTSEIGEYFDSLGEDAKLGNAAQRLRDKWVNSLTGNDNEDKGDNEEVVDNTIDNSTVQLPDYTVVSDGTTGDSTTPIATPSNPEIGSGGVVNTPDNSQEQNVSQDNDITTTINGDGNSVWNNQDNSIRQYGGDNRSFVYNGSRGSSSDGSSSSNWLYDTPASAATMAGFYDVDDSPAAQQQRYDQWTTANRDNQQRYAGSGAAIASMFSNYDARDYTPESIQQAIYDSLQYSRDRADVQTGLTLGDIWRSDYAPDWKMPKAPKPIESNVEDIAEDARDEIENM